jgi:hypothetical protein
LGYIQVAYSRRKVRCGQAFYFENNDGSWRRFSSPVLFSEEKLRKTQANRSHRPC